MSVPGWHCQAEACRCGCRGGDGRCADCAIGEHGLCVGPVEGDWCQCGCQPGPDRAADFIPGFIPEPPDLDDRPVDKLAVIAAELAAERTGSLRDLTAERYQGGGR
jgi:hypothetical protein